VGQRHERTFAALGFGIGLAAGPLVLAMTQAPQTPIGVGLAGLGLWTAAIALGALMIGRQDPTAWRASRASHEDSSDGSEGRRGEAWMLDHAQSRSRQAHGSPAPRASAGATG